MHDNIHQDNILLFCLPYAGGNSFAYQKLGSYLGENITPIALDLPGHGLRFNEPQLETLDQMADYLLGEIENKIGDSTWALFGHSMGGMLAYLVAYKAQTKLLHQPLHIFISARRPASIKPPFNWSDIPGNEFIEKIAKLGGIPDEVLKNKELMELFTPILYRDVKALENHRYESFSPVLSPITVLIGSEDDIPAEQARLWHRDTVAPVEVKSFQGGHFFAFERIQEIGSLIRDTLLQAREDNLEYRQAQIHVLSFDSGDNK